MDILPLNPKRLEARARARGWTLTPSRFDPQKDMLFPFPESDRVKRYSRDMNRVHLYLWEPQGPGDRDLHACNLVLTSASEGSMAFCWVLDPEAPRFYQLNCPGQGPSRPNKLVPLDCIPEFQGDPRPEHGFDPFEDLSRASDLISSEPLGDPEARLEAFATCDPLGQTRTDRIPIPLVVREPGPSGYSMGWALVSKQDRFLFRGLRHGPEDLSRAFGTYLALKRLGSGRDGQAWLFADAKTGHTFVAKFCSKNSSLGDPVEREVLGWHRLGFPEVFALEGFAGKPGRALILPWMATREEFKVLDQKELPREALEAIFESWQDMIRARMINLDYKWEHVGFYRSGGRVRACSLDLADHSISYQNSPEKIMAYLGRYLWARDPEAKGPDGILLNTLKLQGLRDRDPKSRTSREALEALLDWFLEEFGL